MNVDKQALLYRIIPSNPQGHLFTVELTIENPAADGQILQLPVWIPGSYLVREFARHIATIRAQTASGNLAIHKLDKQTWRCAPTTEAITVIYQVYAWDLSVRTAHLDDRHGFFNGTSVFLAVVGQEQQPHHVIIQPPASYVGEPWKVATTLHAVKTDDKGFGLYSSADYDELIDHPVEMGTFVSVDFDAAGTPHSMAVTGCKDFDSERLARDLSKICAEQIQMFHEPAPMDHYLFMTMAVTDGYGGLEHRASTALICKRDDLPKRGMNAMTDGYRSFLGLCSHEYFHLWNVKRIKPAAFTPYDLTKENYTTLLWAFEGITSYYDDLFLVRAGVISVESYRELLAQTITRVMRCPGRLLQSVAESSFDSWIKFYRPDENTNNTVVSYYAKGSLVALALDLTIRQYTNDAKSLDDVMRILWQRYGKTGVGVPENGLELVSSEVAGCDMTDFFAKAVYGVEDLPLAELLSLYGMQCTLRPTESDADTGSAKLPARSLESLRQRGFWGAQLSGEEAKISSVVAGGPAEKAGLSPGDVIVAVNGWRTSKVHMQRTVAQSAPQTALKLHAFRRDELFETTLIVGVPNDDTCSLTLIENQNESAQERRRRWLGRI